MLGDAARGRGPAAAQRHVPQCPQGQWPSASPSVLSSAGAAGPALRGLTLLPEACAFGVVSFPPLSLHPGIPWPFQSVLFAEEPGCAGLGGPLGTLLGAPSSASGLKWKESDQEAPTAHTLRSSSQESRVGLHHGWGSGTRGAGWGAVGRTSA